MTGTSILSSLFPDLGDEYSATCFAQSMILEDGMGTSTLGDFNTALTVKCLTDHE